MRTEKQDIIYQKLSKVRLFKNRPQLHRPQLQLHTVPNYIKWSILINPAILVTEH